MRIKLSFDPNKIVTNAQKRASLMADAIAERARIEMRKEVPVDTGNLRDSHIVESYQNRDNELRLVGPDEDIAPYAFWIYFGRGWVYPVFAQALHWVNKQGEDVFAKSSRPVEPNPWVDRAYENTLNKLKSEIKNVSIIQS